MNIRSKYYDILAQQTSRLNPQDDNSRRVCEIESLLRTIELLYESQEPKALEGNSTIPLHGNRDTGYFGREVTCILAKPQEEPKECCPQCHSWKTKEGVDDVCSWPQCPCHQKETEPKEVAERDMDLERCKNKECIGYKKGYNDGWMVEHEQNALRNSAAIILPRPKGKSISYLLFDFIHSDYYEQGENDESTITSWNQFIKSQE